MTDRELFEKALEAMEHLHRTGDTQVFDLCYAPELIPALRERLAQPVHPECKTRRTTREEKIVRPGVYEVPVEQETVMAEYKFQTYAAYKTPDGEMKIGVVPDDAPLTLNGVPLYPRREWVGLTEDELWDLWNSYIEEPFPEWFVDFKKAYEVIEAKLKEKNT